jgi:hypothetical protein
MDYQTLFNISLGLVAFFGGWTLSNITKALERLDADIRKMPLNYVTREDYRDDIKEIKEILRQMFDRLNGKVDKGDH